MSLRDDIDFEQSRAILLGTSKYTAGFEGRRPMPAALTSLAEMRRVLTGPCEWPDERITEYADERDSGNLLRKITALIGDVSDVLLFYYVGHGQPLSGSGGYDLGLALTDTSEDVSQRALTSLRFRDLREQMEHNSKARIKILILDCCCAGMATKYAESSSNISVYAGNPNPLRGAGTYIWAACGHTQETFYEPKKKGLTYFTRSLSEAVHEARDTRPSGTTVAHLHDEVTHRLSEASIANAADPPVPDLRYSGRPDQFLFVRGRSAPTGDEFRFKPLKNDDPRRVGPYELKACLGDGGNGRVFLAFMPAGQPIAVKVLKPEFGQDPEFAERFAREIKTARQVQSRNVAQLLDANPNAREPWLASTYVCGPSLLELVKETGPLPTRDIMLITAGIARGLQDIHGTKAVHRDLKPANIMLDETGPKIIDFGIAKSVTATRLTRTNTQLGTPAYKSPEQATGKEISGKSDVFTLGSTIYYLATGELAFDAEDPWGIIHLIREEEPDLSRVDEDLRGLLRKCLAKDPEQRPTPEEVAEICAAAAEPVTPGASLGIAQAAGPIRARAEALRVVTSVEPPPVDFRTAVLRQVPPPEVQPPPAPAPPIRAADGDGPTLSTGVRPPVPPGDPKKGPAVAVLVLICLVLAGLWLPGQLSGHGSSDDKSGDTPLSSGPGLTTEPDTPDDDESSEPPTDPPTTPSESETPSPTPSEKSAIEKAQAGDCFANRGTYQTADLRAATCGNGVFKVIKTLHDVTDASGCLDVPDADLDLHYSGYSLALCLSYQTSGTAYHAQVGDCVYGPNSTQSQWNQQGCQTGNFAVKARLKGTTDKSGCTVYSGADEALSTTTSWSELNLVLCLSTNYPDAIGRAPVGTCLLETRSGQNATFQNASCSQANVVVTGRVAQYNDGSFCGSNHWSTWRNRDFPNSAYTVCFRDKA